MGRGKVYLVGAGPGDPKLITVKGLELLKKADAVVYDRLANPILLQAVRPEAQKIYVGKLPDRHTMQQEEINQLLVDLALEDKFVVRLKGGDPCVFGRVGEEAELLVDHGVEYEIVPGITSAVAVPAYAGIPVTHRDYNSSFSVITGHEKPEKLKTTLHWDKLATASDTLIFLMGVAKIDVISEQLMKHGRDPETPVALIRWGTRAEQQTLVGTLATIAEQVKRVDFQPPATIVVGDVIKLREKLAWYEKKPLFGRRVLVTRSRTQASELSERIYELGGEAIELPVIEIRRKHADEQIKQYLAQLGTTDWIVFTSVNGVRCFFELLREQRIDIRRMHQAKIAAVGPQTAELLYDKGLQVDLIPATYEASHLANGIIQHSKPGQKVLLAKGNLAREVLPKALRAADLHVTEMVLYETALTPEPVDDLVDMLQSGQIDMVTFTSSSTVANLFRKLEQSGVSAAELLTGVTIACIGSITAETATQHGLTVDIIPPEATIDSLVAALLHHDMNMKEEAE